MKNPRIGPSISDSIEKFPPRASHSSSRTPKHNAQVYGNPEKGDFTNISSMCSFFTPKRNVLWDLLVDKGIVAKKQNNRKPVRTSSYKEWSKLNHLS
jgi:hypothetical protein